MKKIVSVLVLSGLLAGAPSFAMDPHEIEAHGLRQTAQAMGVSVDVLVAQQQQAMDQIVRRQAPAQPAQVQQAQAADDAVLAFHLQEQQRHHEAQAQRVRRAQEEADAAYARQLQQQEERRSPQQNDEMLMVSLLRGMGLQPGTPEAERFLREQRAALNPRPVAVAAPVQPPHIPVAAPVAAAAQDLDPAIQRLMDQFGFLTEADAQAFVWQNPAYANFQGFPEDPRVVASAQDFLACLDGLPEAGAMASDDDYQACSERDGYGNTERIILDVVMLFHQKFEKAGQDYNPEKVASFIGACLKGAVDVSTLKKDGANIFDGGYLKDLSANMILKIMYENGLAG